ncbi:MAG: cellulase family glycosylhydrolase [Saprospiraceae bacterium]|nr:cellulase family glycosylhydrolase [Candidatus Brachybacter algidus]
MYLRHNIILSLFISIVVISCSKDQDDFVKINKTNFEINGKDYTYIGTNYWYGPSLYFQKDEQRGIKRLSSELDFLVSKGIKNLRIVAAVEGEGLLQGVPRVGPVYQSAPGVFQADNLKGLDLLLSEMSKRKMKAVLFFSNNWDWSGGFLQYLRWNNQVTEEDFQAKLSWDSLRDVVSKFYSCAPCKEQYLDQVLSIINRKNTVTGQIYKDDGTIMAWQLANEPRPMRPAALADYIKWISDVAAEIKKIDSKHLVTIGVEGEIGTENIETFKKIHSDKNIDYATIHIWPRNWSWYKELHDEGQFAQVLELTKSYIDSHSDVMKELGKPLVLEEFGYPRDNNSFSPDEKTSIRDKFYGEILNKWNNGIKDKSPLRGINFWAFGGQARPIKNQNFWKEGDDYMGDPPMEEQGLYSVFDSDTSTWNVITKYQIK